MSGPYRSKIAKLPNADEGWEKERAGVVWWCDFPQCSFCRTHLHDGKRPSVARRKQSPALDDVCLQYACRRCGRITFLVEAECTPWWRRVFQWRGRVREWVRLEVKRGGA